MKVIFRNSSLVFERASSVNLIAKYGVQASMFINDKGEQITSPVYNTTNIAPTENYTKVLAMLVNETSSTPLWISCYNNSKAFISQKFVTFTSEPVAIPSHAKYIRVSYTVSEVSEIRIQE